MISRRQIISGSVGPIFAIFSRNESILGVDYWPGPLFWYLKGRCHGNRFCAKMGQNYLPPALIALSLRNIMDYRLADARIKSYTNRSTSCKKMAKIGSVVFELNRGRKWKVCRNCTIFVHLAYWHSGRWNDFCNLYIEWKRFGCRWSIWTSFFDISRDVAMATNFGLNLRNDLHSAPWHFKTRCTIVLRINAFIATLIALHRVKKWWKSVQ